ncbi:MAG: TldD/PmbA family protein [Bdellovibrionales bacterium]|nr:TldD/PmbA family protein [Bdellovibrionales bacterium]
MAKPAGSGLDTALDTARAAVEKATAKLGEKPGAVQYEIFLNRSSSTKIESKDQKVESFTRSEDVGLSIRVKRQNRVGFSFTTSLADDAIIRAADSAFQVAEVMPEEPDVDLGGFDAKLPTLENRFDDAGLAVAVEEKIALAKRLEKLCREADPRVKSLRSAAFSENEGEYLLASHEGAVLRHRGTMFSASLACKAEENGDAQMGYEYVFSPFLSKLDLEFCAKGGAQSATELLGATKPRSMKCPAVIRNDVVSELVEFIAGSFAGDEIEKGKSLLQGKHGEKVFADFIQILDDGLRPGGLATRPFDAEGTASRTTKVVENGVFKSMLLDRKYAKRFKLAPTGNSSRGVKAPPSISTTNFYLEPGTRSLADLVRDVGNGILITNLMGVHTANSVTGNFSVGASGILIENGKLAKPVKGFAVAGNVLGLFRDAKALGSDLRFFGTVGAPSLLIPELAVSGD